MEFVEPFKINIEESLITCNDPKCPANFREILDKITRDEDGEVMLREIGF
ncbi:MAG: hypothetical protein U9Q66_01060 [Patescibacteria group bacterium]|nr:hypothetical protein [Patescibacteria group bacterium]